MKQIDIAKKTGLDPAAVCRALQYINNIESRLPTSIRKVLKATGRKVVVINEKESNSNSAKLLKEIKEELNAGIDSMIYEMETE